MKVLNYHCLPCIQNISLEIHVKISVLAMTCSAFQSRQRIFEVIHSTILNKLCSIWLEEFFLWFLFHFSIFSEVCRAESRKYYHPHRIHIIQLYNSMVSRWKELLMVLGKSVLHFSWLEHKSNIEILLQICWNYNSDKLMTGWFFFFEMFRLALPHLSLSRFFEGQFCKQTSSMPNLGQTVWEKIHLSS